MKFLVDKYHHISNKTALKTVQWVIIQLQTKKS